MADISVNGCDVPIHIDLKENDKIFMRVRRFKQDGSPSNMISEYLITCKKGVISLDTVNINVTGVMP